jgi:hypothetical protein
MKNYAIIILSILTQAGFAQKEFDNWYFGANAGMSFVSGAPVALTGGAINTNEGCASISTASGTLLFYTDGRQVYNANHQQMSNGFGLNGGYSSSQSAIIIPDPANPDLYYVFTVDEMAGSDGLCYSKVDMNLASGLGDVTVKNVQLVTPVIEQIAAVKNANGNGYWIIVHGLSVSSGSYYAYPVTATGVGNPVISNVSTLTPTSTWIGCMRVSPDGTKIVHSRAIPNEAEIADFDAATGMVSNPFIFYLGANNQPYGVEFSATGNVLYIVTWSPQPNKLYQLNMAAGSIAAILASATVVFNIPGETGTLHRASDNKIYLAHHATFNIGIINDPDSLGTACNYVDQGYVSPDQVLYGLQNSISGSVIPNNILSLNNTVGQLRIFPNPFTVQCTIEFHNPYNDNFILYLHDITGRLIETSKTTGSSFMIRKGSKPAGVYLFDLLNEKTGEKWNGKIVISD